MTSVLAVLEQRDGALRGVSHEVVTAARRLADALGGTVEALLLAPRPDVKGVDALGRFGADKVTVLHHATVFARYAPEACARAVTTRATGGKHAAVLLAASATGRDLAPRVAAQLGVPLASDAIDLSADGDALVVTRPVYAGKALLKIKMTARPAVVSLRPSVFTPVERPKAGTLETPSLASGDSGRVVVREVKAAPAGSLDVGEAPIVVSGGRGLKEPANFKVLEDLARAFGGRAAVGASRAVVDAGWRPHADQVGQTGKTVSPTLYIAVGISGAIQHLAGMRTAKVIVAINRDKDAPIFKVADYGIVGDLFEVVPKLTEEIKKLDG
ncbi:MAG TPA: electron transfer flavoprotein subunit alpha/FixB family protein [Gemmatimonadales bacterium]|nr:electron transfer flavoprotein subunit alpha/FixB family protein [Gemmatimonadales bacterium]